MRAWVVMCRLLSLTSAVAHGEAWRDTVERVAGRRATLPRGHLTFRQIEAVIPREQYVQMRSLVALPTRLAPDALPQLEAQLRSPTAVPLRGFEGDMFYDGAQWRLVRHRDAEIDAKSALDRQRLLKQGQKFAPVSQTHEDVAFTGERIEALENGKWLYYRAPTAVGNYPQPMMIDISLADWDTVLRDGPAADQRIESARQGDTETLAFRVRGNSGIAAGATHEFDVALGYVSKGTRIYAGSQTLKEVTYGYGPTPASGDPLTPVAVIEADSPDKDMVRVSVWLIKTWSQEVRPNDLKVAVPDTVFIADERFGPKPLIFKREFGKEVSVSDIETTPLALDAAGQMPRAAAAAAATSSSNPAVQSSSQIWPYIAVLAIVTSGVVVWHVRNRRRATGK